MGHTKKLSAQDTSLAAEILESGQVVALPTETVYGLAGQATDESALLRIFESKERPLFDPLIVHLPENFQPWLNQVIDFSKLSETEKSWISRLTKKFWPGPMTLVLPKKPVIPDLATAGLEQVAVRVPRHPVFQSVLRLLKTPLLAAPSANRFGRISPTRAEDVVQELDGRIAALVDGGPCQVGVESTVIAITNGQIHCLRPGGLAIAEIESLLGISVLKNKTAGASASPGQLPSHYAPQKPLRLVAYDQVPRDLAKTTGVLLYKNLSPTLDSHEAARNLFRCLRELDGNPQFTDLLAELPPNSDKLNWAIEDRLKRAAATRVT